MTLLYYEISFFVRHDELEQNYITQLILIPYLSVSHTVYHDDSSLLVRYIHSRRGFVNPEEYRRGLAILGSIH